MESGGAEGQLPSQIVAWQLTLYQPGTDYSYIITIPPPSRIFRPSDGSVAKGGPHIAWMVFLLTLDINLSLFK